MSRTDFGEWTRGVPFTKRHTYESNEPNSRWTARNAFAFVTAL
jgi:hypothetical protein